MQTYVVANDSAINKTTGIRLNYFGCIPLRSRWSLRGSGCPGLRFAAVLRTAPVSRSPPIPCTLRQRLSDSMVTTASGPGSAVKRRIRPLPKPTAPARPSPAFPPLPAPRCATFDSSLRTSAPHSLCLLGSGRSGHCGTVPAYTSPPTADAPKLQHHRLRGGPLPKGQPAAPTVTHGPGPPHATPGGRTAIRSTACRQPGASFGQPLPAHYSLPRQLRFQNPGPPYALAEPLTPRCCVRVQPTLTVPTAP